MARMGMDVEAVESIARGIQGDAERLGELTASVEALVRRLPGLWRGSDATRFVEQRWPQHRTTLAAVQESVRGLGQSALNNAADQRAASDATAGGVATNAHFGGAVDPSWWAAAGGGLHGATDLAATVSDTEVPKAFRMLGPVVGGLQIVTGTVDGVTAYRDGDWGRLGGDAVDVALAGAGLAAGALAAPEIVTGLAAFGIAKAAVDASIPYSAQSQDQLLDYEARKMFGVGTSGMTPAQATALSERYSGPVGMVTMVSDKMSETTDDAVSQIGGVVNGAADGIGTVWHWMTGH